jgi:hypothetical protein
LPEPVIVRQLLGWRFASSTEEIRARIGTVPGGDHALREALAKERHAATVWCLVVTIGARRPEISVHGSQDLAEVARDEALTAADATKAVQWWIAERLPGGGTRGSLTGDTVKPPPPPSPPPRARGATPEQRRWARGPRL